MTQLKGMTEDSFKDIIKKQFTVETATIEKTIDFKNDPIGSSLLKTVKIFAG